MAWESGYPQPSDLLEDLRRVYKNEEPAGGEKTARRRRMRRALEADPVSFLEVFSRQQEHYDRRVAAWWARKHRLEDRQARLGSRVTAGATRPEVPVAAAPEEPEAENRALDVLEGL